MPANILGALQMPMHHLPSGSVGKVFVLSHSMPGIK
jgi:hypothetical protein